VRRFMHIPQHLQSRRTRGNFEVLEYFRLVFHEVADDALQKRFDFLLIGREAFLFTARLRPFDLGSDGLRVGSEGVREKI
jgi:hypothetical protein